MRQLPRRSPSAALYIRCFSAWEAVYLLLLLLSISAKTWVLKVSYALQTYCQNPDGPLLQLASVREPWSTWTLGQGRKTVSISKG